MPASVLSFIVCSSAAVGLSRGRSAASRQPSAVRSFSGFELDGFWSLLCKV